MFVDYSFAGYSFVPARHTYWAETSNAPDGIAEIQVRSGGEGKWEALDESHDAACLEIGNYLAVVLEVTAHMSPDDYTRLCLVEEDIDTFLDIQQMLAGEEEEAVEWEWDIRCTDGARTVVYLADFAHD